MSLIFKKYIFSFEDTNSEMALTYQTLQVELKQKFENSVQRFVKLCREHFGDSLLAILVFGSYVKNVFRKGSDIDFIVIHEASKETVKSFEKSLPNYARFKPHPTFGHMQKMKFDEENDIPWHIFYMTPLAFYFFIEKSNLTFKVVYRKKGEEERLNMLLNPKEF
ncbi:MAG: hypothetical protein DRO36_02055 [Candidatus Hecatellales archaeon]|nr:MAG: hypothetical protein DRO36_02055 [Candidatus Hecatellales archaeon]